ncbi:MAG: helix-turn-helix domain-containing protein, partial [Pseudomonadota bacterium]
MDWADEQLQALMERARVKEKASYTLGETARVLGVSRSQVYLMTRRYEPGRGGLDSFLLRKQARVPHEALAAYLRDNRTHEREHRHVDGFTQLGLFPT